MKKILLTLAKSSVFSICLVVSGLMLASCSEEVENRGYVTKFSDFSKVKPGVSTKTDVIQALGSPTATSIFGQETWFYLGKEETKETFFTPEVKNYEGYSIVFNEKGIVTSIDKKDKNSLRDFQASGDSTPTAGNKVTVMQQLLGNLGKFNPAAKNGHSHGGGTGPTPPGL